MESSAGHWGLLAPPRPPVYPHTDMSWPPLTTALPRVLSLKLCSCTTSPAWYKGYLLPEAILDDSQWVRQLDLEKYRRGL